MPFITPVKRQSLTKSTTFSKYTNVDESPYFYLQKRKGEDKKKKPFSKSDRPPYRIVTKYPLHEVAYGYDLEEIKSREWQYIIKELPEMIPQDVTEKELRSWFINHFTMLAMKENESKDFLHKGPLEDMSAVTNAMAQGQHLEGNKHGEDNDHEDSKRNRSISSHDLPPQSVKQHRHTASASVVTSVTNGPSVASTPPSQTRVNNYSTVATKPNQSNSTSTQTGSPDSTFKKFDSLYMSTASSSSSSSFSSSVLKKKMIHPL